MFFIIIIFYLSVLNFVLLYLIKNKFYIKKFTYVENLFEKRNKKRISNNNRLIKLIPRINIFI